VGGGSGVFSGLLGRGRDHSAMSGGRSVGGGSGVFGGLFAREQSAKVLPADKVGRCRLKVFQPVLKAPMVSALEATIW